MMEGKPVEKIELIIDKLGRKYLRLSSYFDDFRQRKFTENKKEIN